MVKDGRAQKVWIRDPTMENFPWQTRSRRAGLTQRLLAKLLGHDERTVSFQLREHWKSGVPRHVRSAIIAWELMSEEQRAHWIVLAQAEFGQEDEKPKQKRTGPEDLERENEGLRAKVQELMRKLRNSGK